eukprot:2840203-Prymnesium_polylepis.3
MASGTLAFVAQQHGVTSIVIVCGHGDTHLGHSAAGFGARRGVVRLRRAGRVLPRLSAVESSDNLPRRLGHVRVARLQSAVDVAATFGTALGLRGTARALLGTARESATAVGARGWRACSRRERDFKCKGTKPFYNTRGAILVVIPGGDTTLHNFKKQIAEGILVSYK